MKHDKRNWDLLQNAGLNAEIQNQFQYEAAIQANFSKLINIMNDADFDLPIKARQIKRMHKILFDNVMSNAGQYSKKQMSFGGFIGSPVCNIEQEFNALDQRLAEMWNVATLPDDKIRILTIQHASIIAIHGFEDGNGRISRLVFEISLERIGLAALLNYSEHQEVCKANYLKSNNLALKTGQIGFLSQSMSQYCDVEYSEQQLYTSACKINILHNNISQLSLDTINQSKTLTSADIITRPTTEGRWLNYDAFNQLHAMVGGKLSRKSATIKTLFERAQHFISLGNLAALLYKAKNEGFKSGLFHKINNHGFIEFFVKQTQDLKLVLLDEQYNNIVNLAEKVMDGKIGAKEMDDTILACSKLILNR